MADSDSSPAPTRTVTTLRMTSEAVPSAREWARANFRDASVTAADRLVTTKTKTAVSTTSTADTGQATIASTTMALRTTTTIRRTPQCKLSMPSTRARRTR